MPKRIRLIEVLVVIVILVIVIAILIPNLLSSRIISHAEKAGSSALRFIAAMEVIWFQQDCDGNGIKDYWTYDISCMHRIYRTDNETKICLIPLDLAKADIAPSDPSNKNPFGGMPLIETWTTTPSGVMIQPKSGYWFSVMITNNLTGQTDPTPSKYNVNPVGDGKIKACNPKEFAFMAAPDVYGSSGIYSYIVNEAGIIYGANTGAINEIGAYTDAFYADTLKEIGTGYGPGTTLGAPGTLPTYMPIRWTTDGTTNDILAWPTKDPTTRKTKSGNPWKVAD